MLMAEDMTEICERHVVMARVILAGTWPAGMWREPMLATTSRTVGRTVWTRK